MNDSTIPKRLFMVWLGDNVPSYVQFSMNAYKEANPDFDIQLVHFTMQQIEDAYYGKTSTVLEHLLHDSIHGILSRDQNYISKLCIEKIDSLAKSFGDSIRFMQVLSDIYRLKLVSTLGGLYVDCDTFPLKPFDDKLLQLKQFIVARHYNNIAGNTENNIGDDNYFLGSIPSIESCMQIQLLQTCNRWWTNMQYIINRRKFFDLRLHYYPKQNQPFYIEHYCDGNWKLKNGRIRTQKCFLDELYYGKRKK